jgi:hypothetical protein
MPEYSQQQPESAEDGIDIEEFLARDPALAVCMEEIARREHMLEALLAQRVAQEVGRMVRTENCRSSDGMGAPVRMMPAFAYHDIAAQMGTYECYQDRSFNRYLDRKAPETVVKPTGTKLQVGWDPGREVNVEIFGSGNAPRFRKRYGGDE